MFPIEREIIYCRKENWRGPRVKCRIFSPVQEPQEPYNTS